jgi:hypothetical protein
VATKKLRSIKGRRVRITRLDSCGIPVYSTCSQVVSEGFITVTIGREEEAGAEYVQKNAWGDFCINEKDPDILKWVNVSVQFCEVDPDILDIIADANAVVSGADTIGATFGTAQPTGGFALEVWTKKTGVDACAGGVTEWGYFAVPFVKNGKLDGDITIEANPLNVSLAGQGFAVPAAWGRGPHGDNPLLATFPTGDVFGYVVTTQQPPAATVGCADLPERAKTAPTDVFLLEPTITAEDAPNAAKLAALGYVALPLTAWAMGEYFSIGTFKFNWSGAAWAAGAHA